ncbi:MAG: CoA-binding protein [Bacteroidales bacterium]|nr:CoA-binding protein [Bacteroidales bacterium]MDD3664988.1 CoA-binding protein [Bacteroidales bacterium]
MYQSDQITVVVLGASLNPHRYANLAVNELTEAGYNVVAIGNREGVIGGVAVSTRLHPAQQAHTATVYLRPSVQALYEAWLLSGSVKRVVFNPGTENLPLRSRLEAAGVEVVFDCTLVMLSRGVF